MQALSTQLQMWVYLSRGRGPGRLPAPIVPVQSPACAAPASHRWKVESLPKTNLQFPCTHLLRRLRDHVTIFRPDSGPVEPGLIMAALWTSSQLRGLRLLVSSISMVEPSRQLELVVDQLLSLVIPSVADGMLIFSLLCARPEVATG